jgi:Tol biopolymer transport system component
MTKPSRSLLFLVLPLWVLAACGMDPESGSPVDTTLDLAGVASDCPAGDISQAISEIFPTKKNLRHVATVNCGQIFKDFGKGKQRQAIQKAFKFFEKTLEQNEKGQLLDPDPSVEAKVGELFTAIFAGIGFDLAEIDPTVLADGEYAFGELIPNGAPLITVSGHAGIDDGGGLFGPVSVFIVKIPPAGSEISLSSESHPCPAGVDDSFDCYPLFFDYSVFPESNVNPAVGLQLGQCNVSPSGVEVLLLSPEGFLPEDDAPTGVVCGDVEAEEVTMTGWRSYAWAVLEPISPLFRVTPAIAGKSPIGGRISAFSPVAPADPTSGGEEEVGSISGQVIDSSSESSIQDATVELFTDGGETFVSSTTSNSDGNYFFHELDLSTYVVEVSATGYQSASSGPIELSEESQDAGNVDIGLDPVLIEIGSISGQVTDNSTESSIQDVTVDLFTDSGETLVSSTTTNSNGNYFFDELDLSTYVVEASAAGYQSASSGPVELTEESPDAENVDIGLDPESPANGSIAFTSDRDGIPEIYVMNADGTGQTRLTNNGAYDDQPAWSPDGTKIAFSSIRDGISGIFVMSSDGTGQTRLTNSPAHDSHPTWSPDGAKIAFESNRDNNPEIYVMNADGTGLINLINNPANDSRPAWSPDGTKIAFASDRDGIFGIFVMNSDGTEPTNLIYLGQYEFHPAWSPDGAKIAFENGQSRIDVMNSDGTGGTNLTSAGLDAWPAWSPGTKIAFASNRDGNFEIYVINADGTGETRLVNNPASDFEPAWRP